MGGECNYLLEVGRDWRLHFVEDRQWKSEFMRSWQPHDIEAVLDSAQAILLESAARLRVPVQVRLPQGLITCIRLRGCIELCDGNYRLT